MRSIGSLIIVLHTFVFSTNHNDVDVELFEYDDDDDGIDKVVRTPDGTLATTIVIFLVGMLWLFSIYRLYRVWAMKLNFDGVSRTHCSNFE